jgi:uncharacterized protein (DUF1015 family)
MAADRPWSFLHISKPEIDLPAGADPYAPAVYAKAKENLGRMIDSGMLIRDPFPAYYVYRLSREGRVQTGLAAVASVAAYRTNRIRRHELTTPLKEDDRVRQIEAVNAETGPVMIAYPDAPELDAILASVTAARPEVDVTRPDGVRHQMWPVTDETTIAALTRAVDALPALYIADGHHRSAAASRVAEARGDAPQAADYFLAVLFPAREMTILGYHRVLRDLAGRDTASLLAALGRSFAVEAAAGPIEPASREEFGMVLAGGWYRLRIRPDLVPAGDPIGRLPITLLTRHVIEPLFGITDQRKDRRIDFVGGGRGLAELERLVTSGEAAAAFALYPTQMSDLMAVADAGGIMPPKSTWFEPKLADGLVSHVLD